MWLHYKLGSRTDSTQIQTQPLRWPDRVFSRNSSACFICNAETAAECRCSIIIIQYTGLGGVVVRASDQQSKGCEFDSRQVVHTRASFTKQYGLVRDWSQLQQESCAIAKMTAQCALYMVPLKFSGLPDYAHGYYSQQFSWAFVLIHLMNVP